MKLNRHSLLFKIFFSLWATIMIFALTPLLLILTSSQESRDAFYEHSKKGLNKQIINNLRNAAEKENIPLIIKETKRAEELFSVNLYVFDENNNEIQNRPAPKIAIETIGEMTDDKIVLIKKLSEDKDDKRIIKAYKANKYTMVGIPAEKPKPAYAYVIITKHINIFLYILLLSSVASLILVRYFSKPLTTLSRAARKIADGDFSVRVSDQVNRRDEIGLLAKDFDLMANKLQINRQNQAETLRNVSHELRSPLTRLRLSLELARAKSGDNAANALDRIEKESDRLNEMIGELLNIFRIKSTKNIETEAISIDEVIKSILPDAVFEANEMGKTINYSSDKELEIRGNRELIVSGLENILRNSIKYAESKVDIDATRVNGFVNISINDNGEGVGDEHLIMIFAPFYRVQDDRDRKTGGTGLGLTIAKTIIEAHGGSIRAYNNKEGGLCVEILLPRD